MAEEESTVALNIGSQRISMAVFEPAKGGGLVLKKFDSTTILADPAAEMARIPQIRVAVGELADRLKVSKRKVRYAVSGQSVFTRFVKLPALDDDNIDQLVAFEAQQHVPFPIDEVVWDWQLLDATGPEKEVVLVAIKADALNEVNDAVGEAGLGTAEVDAAPMALYNAFKFNYPEEEDCVLLIDVGARATNLVYIEGNRFFTRSLSIGGASITTAISKDYNIPFPEAEMQKVSNGVVSLGGGHTDELDEPTAALATTIRNALNRLPAEVARTNNFYRSQHDGSPPVKVYLAGGSVQLPYLREFLEEKLKLPIEIFNPLGSVSVAKGVDVEKLGTEAHLMGELVGLGLRGVNRAPVKIDLVPGVVEAERATARRMPFLITAALIFLAGVGAWAGFKGYAAGVAKTKAEEIEAELQKVKPLANQLNQLAASGNRVAKFGGQYADAELGRVRWIQIISE
ncbi:MAG: type IV pilus assembly protein PilM, partial [Akkermansiaceae bacterium]|nr:type IV pilus assembly protein PilM [Akkermansiaceae bacterium]